MDEQDKLLATASGVVREQAFFMRKAIEQENLKDALKYGSNMIGELRTSQLSPRFYYELYMLIFQELQHLSAFFADKSRHGRKLTELYESVQHAGNILPRLYLLVTVGVAYIQSKEAPGAEILRDMAELCKGVQHPIRGLFLRYYLLQMTKDKLQFVIEDKVGISGLTEVCEFILSNFSETTRLWIRISGDGTRDRVRKDRERHDLRILVGASLVRLSQLEGMSRSFYSGQVLPKILDQVISTKDCMAQQYLLDCTVQVFPDDFHLGSLQALLAACSQTQKSVDLRPVLVNLMNRLRSFLQTSNNADDEGGVLANKNVLDVFGLFRVHLEKIMDRTSDQSSQSEDLDPSEVLPITNAQTVESTAESAAKACGSMLELLQAFLGFTISLCGPTALSQISLVHGMALAAMDKFQQAIVGIPSVAEEEREDVASAWLDPLIEMIETTVKAVPLATALALSQFGSLIGSVPSEYANKVSIAMIASIMEDDPESTTPKEYVDDPGTLTRFMGIIEGLLQGKPLGDSKSDDESAQFRVCQVVHLFHSPTDPHVDFEMLNTMRSYFGRGGPDRLKFTLPTILTKALHLVGDRQPSSTTVLPVKKVFQFIHNTCTALVSVNPELAFRYWLLAAEAADKLDLDPIAHEFFTQAIVTFEEELVDSKVQPGALLLFVNSLFVTNNLESVEVLATKITQHAAKMLKKIDQCRSVLACAHLFWSKKIKDSKKVLECLQRGLKISDVATQAAPSACVLFIECLNKYVYFMEAGLVEISSAHVSNLVALCQEHVSFWPEAAPFLEQTTAYIEARMEVKE